MEGLLARLAEGDRAAFDDLFPLVYRELHGMAHAQRDRWSSNETLNTTALVHEAYLKLAAHGEASWQDRSHFLAVAARAMRQILMDYAKQRNALKRGAGAPHVSFEEIRESLRADAGLTDGRLTALVALDNSLGRLQAMEPRQARIVECRFFGGMTIKDTAHALGVSPATVKRGWAMAAAWLYHDVKRSLHGEARSGAPSGAGSHGP